MLKLNVIGMYGTIKLEYFSNHLFPTSLGHNVYMISKIYKNNV